MTGTPSNALRRAILTVVQESVPFQGNALRIADLTYDLGEDDELFVLGGGNAAAHVAVALENEVGDRFERVVTAVARRKSTASAVG